MFINEIVVGVLGTLFVESILFLGFVVYIACRGSKRK